MADRCEGEKKVILFACSGTVDVGQLSDKVTRQFSRDGFGGMSCIAVIGDGLSGYVESAKGATQNIDIDGCENACTKLNLEKIGVFPRSYILTDMGIKKGETTITDGLVRSVRQKVESADAAFD